MLARQNPHMAFTSLNHFLDLEWLMHACEVTRKDGAVGVDGQTAQDYARDLQGNLTRLLSSLKSGSHQAAPVRRHYLPKADGKSVRPLGIPTFEDKVAQRAIVMLLEPIYEQPFDDCSFGFRPGRSAHQALRTLSDGIMKRGGRWILDVDIRQYFDRIDHGHLRELLNRRVVDGVVRRLIDKWLKAGVLEEGVLRHSDAGAPQGGVASPLLANAYLHYVLDEWFSQQVQPRLAGPSTLVRYCDDFVMVFRDSDDAKRTLDVLGKRLGRFGLELHPEKTKLVDFRFRRPSWAGWHDQLPVTFCFLGFTHHWAWSRNGKPVVRLRTAKDRFARALRAINQTCRRICHWSIREQHARLCRMLRGHYAYYGVTGNRRMLSNLRRQAERRWRIWLSRRTRGNLLRWDVFAQILARYPLAPVRIVHQYGTTTSKPVQ
jgi:RNA-directed DNA polymerase